jgi:hypothetical protein
MFSLLVTTSLVGEEPSHLWPAFPSDSLGFSRIPGHCVGTVLLSVVWSSVIDRDGGRLTARQWL